jgi:fumarate reductase flavoprotein subunit
MPEQTKRARKTSTRDKADFEVSPPPIPASKITEKVTADVVVVGAGVSGLTAAASASEAGARVIVLEKGETYHFRGLHNAALASKLQKKEGVVIDREKVIYAIMEFASYRNDQRLIKTWADNCDKVMDWLIDMAEVSGVKVVLDTTTKPWYFPNYPVIHVFLPKMQESLVQMLLDHARAHGAELYWETPAVQLIRKGKGRVTGVIGRNKRGEYIQFNARKAVILSTGDYGNNLEMVQKYCPPAVHNIRIVYEPDVNTGDGHKMGLWVGAAIDEIPHLAMIWDFAIFSHTGLFNLGRQPWLYVNTKGERFMNEDLPYSYECNQILQQPDNLAWAVWDAKWEKEWPKMRSQCCKNMGPPTFMWDNRLLEEALENGNVLKADSIEELARKMKVPAATFKATVKRYSELARKGKDEDFGKHPDRLTTLEKPPFYTCLMQSRRMVILSGLKINTRMQVLDTERKVIPGLYASGNVSGGFFGDSYPTTVPGLTHSRAWTFGRLAGLNAAAEKAGGR